MKNKRLKAEVFGKAKGARHPGLILERRRGTGRPRGLDLCGRGCERPPGRLRGIRLPIAVVSPVQPCALQGIGRAGVSAVN